MQLLKFLSRDTAKSFTCVAVYMNSVLYGVDWSLHEERLRRDFSSSSAISKRSGTCINVQSLTWARVLWSVSQHCFGRRLGSLEGEPRIANNQGSN